MGAISCPSRRGLIARIDCYWTWEEAFDPLNDPGEALRGASLADWGVRWRCPV
jgi:hypothetical protein